MNKQNEKTEDSIGAIYKESHSFSKFFWKRTLKIFAVIILGSIFAIAAKPDSISQYISVMLFIIGGYILAISTPKNRSLRMIIIAILFVSSFSLAVFG